MKSVQMWLILSVPGHEGDAIRKNPYKNEWKF